ncbi:MAG: dUTP diphosphatase [Candidatus Shapirobacteria bacterium]
MSVDLEEMGKLIKAKRELDRVTDTFLWKNFYLKVKLEHPDAKMPTRAFSGDAGMDVYSIENVNIPSRSTIKISLGFSVEFPEGYVLIVQDKSGRAYNTGYQTKGNIIDAAYRGICHVVMKSDADDWIYIPKGEKIAQMLVLPCWTGVPEQVEELSDSDRGSGGFGSTGVK